MSRIELPNEQWAELRDPDAIPRKHARQYRQAFYNAASVAMPSQDLADGLDIEDEKDRTTLGIAIARSGELPSVMDAQAELEDALVLAIVAEWSYGPVDSDTLGNMPDNAVDAINERAATDGYIEKLQPDFGVSADEESPTTP